MAEPEILTLLNQLLANQQETNKHLSHFSTRLDSLESKVDSLDSKVGSLDSRLNLIEVNVENIHLDIKTIAEVQKSQFEQNEKSHAEIIQLLNDKSSLLESAIQHVSSDVAELKNNNNGIYEIIGEHDVAIRVLKKKTG